MAVELVRGKGGDVRLPGEVEGEKEIAKSEERQKTAEEFLASVNVTEADAPGFKDLDIEDQIKVAGAVQNERMKFQAEERAKEIAAAEIAPLKEAIAMQQFQAQAQQAGMKIAADAGNAEIAAEVSDLITQIGPGFGEAMQNPLFKDFFDTKVESLANAKSRVTEKEEELELPKAEEVGSDNPGLTSAQMAEKKAYLAQGFEDDGSFEEIMKEAGLA
jgi:hypothetical protein